MQDFYEGALIYDCFDSEEDAHVFIHEYKDGNLNRVFVAIFDKEVSKGQMTKFLVEAVKVTGSSEDEH